MYSFFILLLNAIKVSTCISLKYFASCYVETDVVNASPSALSLLRGNEKNFNLCSHKTVSQQTALQSLTANLLGEI